MNWGWFLFGFSGRINRAKYWLAGLVFIALWIALGFFAVAQIGASFDKSLLEIMGRGILLWTIFAVVLAASVWSGYAVAVKRLHDRDKSGWWALLFFIAPGLLGSFQMDTPTTGAGFVFSLASVVLSLWAIVELGFLRGTRGTNRFGPDPLGGLSSEPLR